MRRLPSLLLLAAVVIGMALWQQARPPATADHGTVSSQGSSASTDSRPRVTTDGLPAEARATLAAIARGGPFPHRQDGVVFGNYEGLLPKQPRGYYREYTVETPGARNRGARRIVTGGNPPRAWYYTDDHYRSFRRLEAQP